MDTLAIATLTSPGPSELDALLLAASLRRFGGTLSEAPIWVMVPESLGPLTEEQQFHRLGAEVIPLAVERGFLEFPLAAKVAAAAFAEKRAGGVYDRLAFCDRDTLFLQEPTLLARSGHAPAAGAAVLSYRPVHHRLIGSAWNEPVDAFWEMLFSTFGVAKEGLFMMRTNTGEEIRPYFNAGHFSVDPAAGIMAQWLDAFAQNYQTPAFTAYYQQDQRYAIFAHQTILTGVILAACEPAMLRALPDSYNYPLHLHEEVVEGRTTAGDKSGIRLQEPEHWVTVRTEDIFDGAGRQSLPFAPHVAQWLATQPRVLLGERNH